MAVVDESVEQGFGDDGVGTNAQAISNQLLAALFDAYVEAASTTGRIAP